MKKDDCIFCKLANGEIPTNAIYEDDRFKVILDMGPATRGHALILPKDHAANLFDLPDETAAAAFCLAKKLGSKMVEALQAEGMNVVQNNGEAAGQTVPHFHLHLIPRFEGDGQTIGWNPGKPSGEELAALAQELRGAVQ
ncbi:MAG: HIT family protein [Lachnospiraceae bacterium]|nr:HIT family protein [Lachnospiraceae bacterium]MCR5477342.1 HIT family protein [Lachnospiraceae bacterium]